MEGMKDEESAGPSSSSACEKKLASQNHSSHDTVDPSTMISLPTTKKICQECSQKEALYVCPRCSFRSCSLICCVSHKKRLKCNGQRVMATDNNSFLPLSRMNDATLQEDYHFLEHVLQTVESNQRKRPPSLMVDQHPQRNKNYQRGRGGNQHKRPRSNTNNTTEHSNDADTGDDTSNNNKEPCHPLLQQQVEQGIIVSPSSTKKTHTPNNGGRHSKFKNLQRLAAFPQRRVHLILMSPGMQRTLQNKSFVKKQVIHWTVECVVHSSTSTQEKQEQQSKEQSTDYRFLTILSEEADLHTELLQLVTKRQTELRKLNARDQTVEALLANVQLEDESPKDTDALSSSTTSFQLLLHQPTSKTYRSVARGTLLRQALWDAHLLEFPTFHWVAQKDTSNYLQPLAMNVVATTCHEKGK